MQGNPYAWDRDGNLIVPRYGIRIAMAVALLAVGAFGLFTFLGNRWWHVHNPAAMPTRPEPLWMLMLWIAFPLTPFLISLLLLSRRSEESKAAGAGLAAALFGCSSIFAVGVFVFEFVGFPAPDPYVLENLIAVLVFFICSVWITVSAFRIAAKAGWGLFFLLAVSALVWMGVTSHFLSNAETTLDRQYERHKTQTDTASAQSNYDARQIVARLAGCLIQYRASHRDAGFPASLNALPPDLQLPDGIVCNATIAADGSVPNYTFTYTPLQASSSLRFTDFHLLAMPLKKGLPRVDPFLVDSRGRIFSYVGWSLPDRREPGFAPPLVEIPDDFQRSRILGLREDVRLFMQSNGGAPPAMLSKMSEHSNKSAYNDTLTEGPYRIEYLPPAAPANTYMISAVCQNYGDACLRSFLLDENGQIHETSEPRQPTHDDLLIPDCEKYAQTCRDIDWPQP